MREEGGVAGLSQCTAIHRSPNKLLRSNSIFNLRLELKPAMARWWVMVSREKSVLWHPPAMTYNPWPRLTINLTPFLTTTFTPFLTTNPDPTRVLNPDPTWIHPWTCLWSPPPPHLDLTPDPIPYPTLTPPWHIPWPHPTPHNRHHPFPTWEERMCCGDTYHYVPSVQVYDVEMNYHFVPSVQIYNMELNCHSIPSVQVYDV